jgi:putative tricarboxylic transport membrane protein
VKRGWIVTSLIFIVIFAVTVRMSLALPFLDELGPGPGFFPFWLAALGLTLSALLVIETVRAPADEAEESLVPRGQPLMRILSVIGLLAFAALVLDVLGWRLTALVVAGTLLVALGARSVIAVTAFSLVAGFGIFHVFYYWLKVPLPVGTFGI